MTMPVRAALYLRVSTGRQADNDLSIPDQRRQAKGYCASRGWEIVADYVEPGLSATDDRRPEFQRMIDAATTKPPAFDVILVHSFSRFFRDQFQLEFYVRRLAKAGVRLVSITQELGDDPMSNMIRQIMALFDEYQSRENAKHTLRAMKENARQGFWNGALPPIGYRIVEATEQRGHRTKALDMKCPAELYTSSARAYAGLPDLTYPFHDRDVVVTACGRLCLHRKKINISTVLAGQKLGIKEVDEGIWLVSFMHYDLGYFDLEQKTLQPLDNPFGPRPVTHVSATTSAL